MKEVEGSQAELSYVVSGILATGLDFGVVADAQKKMCDDFHAHANKNNRDLGKAQLSAPTGADKSDAKTQALTTGQQRLDRLGTVADHANNILPIMMAGGAVEVLQ